MNRHVVPRLQIYKVEKYKISLQKQLKNKCIVAGNKTARIGGSPGIWSIMALKIKPTAFIMPLTIILLENPARVTIRAAWLLDFDNFSRQPGLNFPPTSRDSSKFPEETIFWTSCSLISGDNLSSFGGKNNWKVSNHIMGPKKIAVQGKMLKSMKMECLPIFMDVRFCETIISTSSVVEYL